SFQHEITGDEHAALQVVESFEPEPGDAEDELRPEAQEEKSELESEPPAAPAESNSEPESPVENATEESAEEKRGFFSRLLRRTDY
ncbi:MAG TPA: hypothetical protein VIH43_04455, partial [Chthoniobacterales bacterium]